MAYLKSKKFGKSEIAQMVSRAPYLLLFSVERLDNRLGFFKNELGLSVKKVKTEVLLVTVVRSCNMNTPSVWRLSTNIVLSSIISLEGYRRVTWF